MRIHPLLLPALAEPARLELVLLDEDGTPWRLTLSSGMERFIGAYPRIEGFDPGEPLLRFRPAGAA